MYLGFEGDQFEDHLHSEEWGEQHVQDVHHVVKRLRLPVVLHVEKDETGQNKSSNRKWELTTDRNSNEWGTEEMSEPHARQEWSKESFKIIAWICFFTLLHHTIELRNVWGEMVEPRATSQVLWSSNQVPRYSEKNQACTLTCTARQMVLSMMRTNMMYSKAVEFTTYQNLYW